MKLRNLLSRYDLESVKFNLKFAEATFVPTDTDARAAWDLYVEMLTRIATQPLPVGHGDERAALESVYSLFPTTRAILLQHGRKAINFGKIAIPVLNQIVRPFTARWHREALAGSFDDPAHCRIFRDELKALQTELRNYNRLLAELAGVEDLTDLERLSEDESEGGRMNEVVPQ